MLRTIRLSGELGRIFGKYHRFDVATAAEAIRALCANFKDFERHLIDSEKRGVAYRVLKSKERTTVERLHDQTPVDVISICPVFSAGKKNGIIPLVIGAVLIAASFFLPGAGFFAAALLASVSLSGIAFSIGASMVLMGVAQMVVKTPKVGKVDKGGAAENYYFNGALNTGAQGGPVPLGYGRMIVGGPIIYAGLFAEDRTTQ